VNANERERPMSLAFRYRRRHNCAQKKHCLYRSAQIVFICVHLRSFAVPVLRAFCNLPSVVVNQQTRNLVLSHTKGATFMTDYRVVSQNISSIIFRDVDKAATELADEVRQLMAAGWQPQGGLATVQAGGGIYLLQAMVRNASE
jgi:hypothetical protein